METSIECLGGYFFVKHRELLIELSACSILLLVIFYITTFIFIILKIKKFFILHIIVLKFTNKLNLLHTDYCTKNKLFKCNYLF